MENIKDNLKTDWWFDYVDFYKMIASKNFKILVEIGVWKGHSISFLANELKKNEKKFKLYAVDLWNDTYRYENYPKLKEQVPYLYDIYTEYKKQSGVYDIIEDLKGLSWEMAKEFKDNSVDFVFIDADHDYEFVIKDIESWYPKIKKGGILSGHDYFNHTTGVKRAVDEKFGNNVRINGSCWYVEI